MAREEAGEVRRGEVLQGLVKLSCGVWCFFFFFYLGNIEGLLRVLRRKESWSNLVFRKTTVGAVGRR